MTSELTPAEQSFTKSGFKRPVKLEWVLPKAADYRTVIPSKSSRKIAQNLTAILGDSQIEFAIIQVTAESYAEWLSYYQRIMTSQGHDLFATPGWLEEKTAAGFSVWMIDTVQQGNRVGAAIFSVKDGTYTCHFKASEHLEIHNWPNVSLGILIEFLFIEHAVAAQANKISSGISRNGFGFYNTLGYLNFKLRLGYQPQAVPDRGFESTFPAHTGKPTIWFGCENAVSEVTQPPIQLHCFGCHISEINPETLTLLERHGFSLAEIV